MVAWSQRSRTFVRRKRCRDFFLVASSSSVNSIKTAKHPPAMVGSSSSNPRQRTLRPGKLGVRQPERAHKKTPVMKRELIDLKECYQATKLSCFRRRRRRRAGIASIAAKLKLPGSGAVAASLVNLAKSALLDGVNVIEFPGLARALGSVPKLLFLDFG